MILFALLALLLSNQLEARHTSSQPNSFVITGVCSNTFACAIPNPPTWPRSGFTCGLKSTSSVSSTAFASASVSIFTGRGQRLTKAGWPSACQTSANADGLYAYNNGRWIAYYYMRLNCQCKHGAYPQCSGATSISHKACNVATLGFCQLVLEDGTKCYPNIFFENDLGLPDQTI